MQLPLSGRLTCSSFCQCFSDHFPSRRHFLGFPPLPWLAGHKRCTAGPGWSKAASAAGFLCSTGTPWPAARCTAARCDGVWAGTHRAEQAPQNKLPKSSCSSLVPTRSNKATPTAEPAFSRGNNLNKHFPLYIRFHRERH